VVVFSHHKDAILHASDVLHDAGISHVRIVSGDKAGEQQSAVFQFNNDPNCQAFLLHAGQGAAGLTLTAARHVVLLEPFHVAGEEAQGKIYMTQHTFT